MAIEVVYIPEDDEALRDEFMCPITANLMHHPVLVVDGHTYERSAVLQWFAKHTTSPKTGQQLRSRDLRDNHNIRRLISDLTQQAPHQLYTRTGVHALPQSVVELSGDACISKEHCEVLFDHEALSYVIRDIGSAGGVFVRVRHRGRGQGHGSAHPHTTRCDDFTTPHTVLSENTAIRIGKHEFHITTIDPREGRAEVRCVAPAGSPLCNHSHVVTAKGATIGRSPSNDISLSVRVDGKTLSIDSTVSSVHARIASARGCGGTQGPVFMIVDGDGRKPSSNGIWLRLRTHRTPTDNTTSRGPSSAPVSRPHVIEDGESIAIGNSVFEAHLEEVVMEEWWTEPK